MTGYATKEELAQITGALNTGLAQIRGEMAGFRGDMEVKLSGLRGDLDVKIADVRTEIANVKTDIIRWVFALFLTTLLAILGLYLKK